MFWEESIYLWIDLQNHSGCGFLLIKEKVAMRIGTTWLCVRQLIGGGGGGGVSGESDKSALRAPVGCHLWAEREHVMIPPPRHLIWGQCDSVFSPACRWVTFLIAADAHHLAPTPGLTWAWWDHLVSCYWWRHAPFTRTSTMMTGDAVGSFYSIKTFFFLFYTELQFLGYSQANLMESWKIELIFSPSTLWYQQDVNVNIFMSH